MDKKTEDCLVITFHTSSDAFAFQALCKKQDIEGRLISIPHELSASCGMAWRSPASLEPFIQQLVEANSSEIEGIHHMVLPRSRKERKLGGLTTLK